MNSNDPDTNNPLKVLMEQRLQELGWDFSRLAREYGRLKEGSDVEPNRYRSTVVRIVQDPGRSQLNNVLVCLNALGIIVQAVIRKVELN
jgi:hypothetical protein